MSLFTKLRTAINLNGGKTKFKLATEHAQPDGSKLITEDGIPGGIIVNAEGFYTAAPAGTYKAADGSDVNIEQATPEDAVKIAEAARAQGITVQEVKAADDAAEKTEDEKLSIDGVGASDGLTYRYTKPGEPVFIVDEQGAMVAAPPSVIIPLADGTVIETGPDGNLTEMETLKDVAAAAEEVIEKQASELATLKAEKAKLELEAATAKAAEAKRKAEEIALKQADKLAQNKPNQKPKNDMEGLPVSIMSKLSGQHSQFNAADLTRMQHEFYSHVRNGSKPEDANKIMQLFNGSAGSLKKRVGEFWRAQLEASTFPTAQVFFNNPAAYRDERNFKFASIDITDPGYDGQYLFTPFITDIFSNSVLFNEANNLVSRIDAVVTHGKLPRITNAEGDILSPVVNCDLSENAGVLITLDDVYTCPWQSNIQYCYEELLGTFIELLLATIGDSFKNGIIPPTILDAILWVKRAQLRANRDNWFLYGNPNAKSQAGFGTAVTGNCPGWIGFVKESPRFIAVEDTHLVNIAAPTPDTIVQTFREALQTAMDNSEGLTDISINDYGSLFFMVSPRLFTMLKAAQGTEQWRRDFDINNGDYDARMLSIFGGLKVIPNAALTGANEFIFTFGKTSSDITMSPQSNIVMLVDETTDTDSFTLERLPYPNQRKYHQQLFTKMGAYASMPENVFFYRW